ncbi:hypothetical protein [Alkalimarinus alittae]|uniref:Uncharacterized protein n=1 Tax=Alkalimarinus alittae TaxID=2961619 RepID=A0ABY6MYZ6_9ALTE|nr:hypothetical protein [Alkalimarinus alittae]UZE95020.1 hypothetical protein NKI27_13200 [Alkalimarinus alittae]
MFIRAIVSFILGFIAMFSYADCDIQDQVLGAHYRIITTDHLTGRQLTRDFTLWRDGHRVAHQYHTKGVTELWEKMSNGKLRTVHYYDLYHRGIEYEPYEINISHSENDWQLKYQLLSESYIKTLTKRATEGSVCEGKTEYSHAFKTLSVQLEWLDQLQLAKIYTEESSTKTVKWELVDVINDKATIKAAFSLREDFKTTDYTDVGDNESDPFLMRMINLGHISHGASGFYDQSGKAIGLGHKH